jgi:hypothetical protein
MNIQLTRIFCEIDDFYRTFEGSSRVSVELAPQAGFGLPIRR